MNLSDFLACLVSNFFTVRDFSNLKHESYTLNPIVSGIRLAYKDRKVDGYLTVGIVELDCETFELLIMSYENRFSWKLNFLEMTKESLYTAFKSTFPNRCRELRELELT